jgi:trehalose-6-phosphatase
MNLFFKIFDRLLMQLQISKTTKRVKIAYFDGTLSQPMPYEAAVWPAEVFGGVIIPLKREI